MACSCIYDQYDLNSIYCILFIEQSELLNVQDASMPIMGWGLENKLIISVHYIYDINTNVFN